MYYEIKGKIEFCEEEDKECDREFTATLGKTGANAYGNQTVVVIVWDRMKNGTVPPRTIIDTRYDESIRFNETDFKKWMQLYLEKNYNKHVLTFY